MDVIELAVLPASTPLVAALVTMQVKQQSAVVRIDGEDLALVGARDIVLALHEDKETLADIDNAEAISSTLAPMRRVRAAKSRRWLTTDATGGSLTRRGVEVMDEPDDVALLAGHFSAGPRYAVSSLRFGRAVIVTSSEQLAGIMQVAPQNCYCPASPEYHNCDLSPGKRCPIHRCLVVCIGS